MFKKFSKINENLQNTLKIDQEIEDLQLDLLEIVDDSVNADDDSLKKETMESYIDDDSTTIIGLVNDSDVFDFYLKHRNQIDIVLSEIDHFEKSPADLAVNTSIYDYIIKSTKVSIQECFKKMLEQ
jgi:hypothetical protein